MEDFQINSSNECCKQFNGSSLIWQVNYLLQTNIRKEKPLMDNLQTKNWAKNSIKYSFILIYFLVEIMSQISKSLILRKNRSFTWVTFCYWSLGLPLMWRKLENKMGLSWAKLSYSKVWQCLAMAISVESNRSKK